MIDNMKTIAITIDDDTLERVDALSAQGPARANRSSIFRTAVREYLNRVEHELEAQRETEIFRKHSKKLNRQAAALIREQGRK
jgi:metal-responsive CopG/Arc/MetJ family transcriptional regulator